MLLSASNISLLVSSPLWPTPPPPPPPIFSHNQPVSYLHSNLWSLAKKTPRIYVIKSNPMKNILVCVLYFWSYFHPISLPLCSSYFSPRCSPHFSPFFSPAKAISPSNPLYFNPVLSLQEWGNHPVWNCASLTVSPAHLNHRIIVVSSENNARTIAMLYFEKCYGWGLFY